MAFGNAVAERRAIEMTYEDTADILRNEPQKDSDNITHDALVIAYSGIACALSKGTNSSVQQKAQLVDQTHVLFAAPELKVLPGDSVKVTRFGKLRAFAVLGYPDVYATHQEIKLKERDLA